MQERKISYYDASIYRMQAMLEQSIKIQVNILAHLTKVDKTVLFETVHKEISDDAQKMMQLHSELEGDADPNQN
jgi:hypothetical protein